MSTKTLAGGIVVDTVGVWRSVRDADGILIGQVYRPTTSVAWAHPMRPTGHGLTPTADAKRCRRLWEAVQYVIDANAEWLAAEQPAQHGTSTREAN